MWNLMHFGLRRNDTVHWLKLAWEMSDNLLGGVRLSQADLWIRIRQNVINDSGEILEQKINGEPRDFAVLTLKANHLVTWAVGPRKRRLRGIQFSILKIIESWSEFCLESQRLFSNFGLLSVQSMLRKELSKFRITTLKICFAVVWWQVSLQQRQSWNPTHVILKVMMIYWMCYQWNWVKNFHATPLHIIPTKEPFKVVN